MTERKHTYVPITGNYQHHTEKALLLTYEHGRLWVPFSQIEGFKLADIEQLEQDDPIKLNVTSWYIKTSRKGLYD